MAKFKVGDKIKFVDSDFVRKISKKNPDIKKFIDNGTVFKIINISKITPSGVRLITAINEETATQLALYDEELFEKA